MTRYRHDHLAGTLAVLVGTVAGCGSTPNAKFYLLSAMPDTEEAPGAALLPADTVIGLQFVELPRHLDRPQVVSRVSRNRLELSEFHRWGEPLKDNVTEVIAANLRTLLATDRVMISPRLGGLDVTYGVRIEILRFDGVPGSTATLQARWGLYAGNDNTTMRAMKHTRYANENVGASYDALVAAESDLLLSLSREIADTIIDLARE